MENMCKYTFPLDGPPEPRHV